MNKIFQKIKDYFSKTKEEVIVEPSIEETIKKIAKKRNRNRRRKPKQ